MAHQTNIKLSITVDNIIYYKSMGRYLIRSKPVNVKQTPATKVQAGIFGKAVKTSATLRSLLKPVLPDAKDRNVMYRLNAALGNLLRAAPLPPSSIVNDTPFITGFEFNEKSRLAERLRVTLTVGRTSAGSLVLNIPPLNPVLDIIVPAHTKSIHWHIMAASCSMNNKPFVNSCAAEILMPFTNTAIAAQQILLPVTPLPGNLTVVALALQYSKAANGETTLIDAIRWNPAGIVAGLYN